MSADDKEFIDFHLDAILKASGSVLKNYSMHQNREGMRKALRDVLAATIAPAQDSQDERADFEAKINATRFFPAELDFTRIKSPSGRDEYENSHLQSNWNGWQLRAQLAAQSAPQQAVPPKIEAWKYQTIVDGEWRVTLNESWAKCINEGSVISLVAAPAADKAAS